MFEIINRQILAALAVATWCFGTSYASGGEMHEASTVPIKIAVFPFELQDFTAAAAEGSSPGETSYLAQSTEEVKHQLLQSGRFSLVDTTSANISAANGRGLRNCGGCEQAMAMKLGADQAIIGVISKISMTEYTVRLQVSDIRAPKIISSFATDLRIGADYSWSRGARWLMQSRMLVSK